MTLTCRISSAVTNVMGNCLLQCEDASDMVDSMHKFENLSREDKFQELKRPNVANQ